jgi:tyrosyl-tRNA synthetase
VTLAHLARRGHPALALVGSATAAVGDPTGRRAERPILTPAELRGNASALRVQLALLLAAACDGSGVSRFALGRASEPSSGSDVPSELAFKPSGPSRGVEFHVIDNGDWQSALTVPHFLRDVGRFFRVRPLLAKEALASRFKVGESGESGGGGGGGASGDEGLTFAEMAYPLLQASDFLHLFDSQYNCGLQVGGSDQWGNITAGCSLIARVGRQRASSLPLSPESPQKKHKNSNITEETGHGHFFLTEAHGVTTPLLTTADGAKLGKSTGGGGVWLDAERTSPFELFQYFMKLADGDACRLLRLLTFIPPEDIVHIEEKHRNAPHRRLAQSVLARALVAYIHGDQEAQRADHASAALFTRNKNGDGFGGGGASSSSPSSSSSSRVRALLTLSGKGGVTELPRGDVIGAPLARLFVASGLCGSMREAKNLGSEGGMYVNDAKVGDFQPAMALDASQLVEVDGSSFVVLRRGKKNYRIVRVD